jgi:uncharacterized protein YjbI with pentapeptide repeats
MTLDRNALERQQEIADETFTGLDGRALQLMGKELSGCRFVRCQFSEAALVRCRLVDCSFESCDLSTISWRGSTLRDVTFESSKLLGVNWTELTAASHLVFRRSVVSLGNFSGMDLRKWVFDACTAREVELAHANLSEADLRGTDWAGSRFLQTNLTKADLRQALGYAIRPADNILKKARFSLPEATSLLYGLDIVLEDA